ncbi:MAG: ribulose-phosphate 3-epimerase [Candidatus Spechtbacterales bacterium]|nr:ribulose-phosphate 3-epimerase [Candidatus Spechtbacterales bacterium]
MNKEIIPAILVDSFEEFQKKIRKVEQRVNWVQLDVSDGDFAPAFAWGDPVQIHDYDAGCFIEVHLMVQNPEKIIDDWLTGRSEEKDSGVQRIYFHYESTDAHEEIVKRIKESGKEVGIAILPDTPISVLDDLLEKLDSVLIFSGNLGFYGGKFSDNEKTTIDKISTLRSNYPNLIIEVDGGMNPETAPKVVDVGANLIVSGGYIWKSKDALSAIKNLEESIS